MQDNRITANKFIIEEQRRSPGATGELSSLLTDLVTACKAISVAVGKGALVGVHGDAPTSNAQGERQKKLDVAANEIILRTCEWGGHLSAMASEELDAP
jgi:fructose-1,6-bisphosphatase I